MVTSSILNLRAMWCSFGEKKNTFPFPHVIKLHARPPRPRAPNSTTGTWLTHPPPSYLDDHLNPFPTCRFHAYVSPFNHHDLRLTLIRHSTHLCGLGDLGPTSQTISRARAGASAACGNRPTCDNRLQRSCVCLRSSSGKG